MKTVYYIDGDTSNARDWSALTGRSAIQIRIDGMNSLWASRSKLSSHVDGIAFIHSAYCSPTKLPKLSEDYRGLIFVVVSGEGLPNGPRGPKYWCVKSPIGKPIDRAFSVRAEKFLSDFEKTGKPDFEKLEPKVEPIQVSALRLLCEAWECMQSQKDGFPINSQFRVLEEPKDWFAPFGVDTTGIGGSAEEWAQMAPAVTLISSRMGDAQAAAEDVLSAVVWKQKLDDPIRKFLEAVGS